MKHIELFLGFPVDGHFKDLLLRVNPDVSAMFIQNKSDYLQQITLHDRDFLGKNLGQIIDISSLNLIQTHILSILKKIIPNYNYDLNSLLLFPLLTNDE